MPAQTWGWLITPEELADWTLADTPRFLAIDKPGAVVCHRSKHGPWSSLVSACREWTGSPRLHMPFRLDRETSGVVILAKDHDTASRMQRAVEGRRVEKIYHAILMGELLEPVHVTGPIGKHPSSAVWSRQAVVESGRAAGTFFRPMASGSGHTFVQVIPETGRMHQIRVHAAHIGHPILGDKIYGPDENFYLEFIRNGLSDAMRAALGFSRQALHCSEVAFPPAPEWPQGLRVQAPLAAEMERFLWDEMNIGDPSRLNWENHGHCACH